MHITTEDIIALGVVLNFVAVVVSHVFHNQKFALLASNASKELEQNAPQIASTANEAVSIAQNLPK